MSMEQLTKEHKVQFYTKVKFLYGITLNSTFSYILPYYHWGRAPDIHIV